MCLEPGKRLCSCWLSGTRRLWLLLLVWRTWVRWCRGSIWLHAGRSGSHSGCLSSPAQLQHDCCECLAAAVECACAADVVGAGGGPGVVKGPEQHDAVLLGHHWLCWCAVVGGAVDAGRNCCSPSSDGLYAALNPLADPCLLVSITCPYRLAGALCRVLGAAQVVRQAMGGGVTGC